MNGRPMIPRLLVAVSMLIVAPRLIAQQTVFNVPTADVLDRGKIYGELDLAYNPNSASTAVTPRVVVGLGHRIEVGLNLNGITTPGTLQTTPALAFKWMYPVNADAGWAFVLGDDVFIPAQNRSYDAGNHVYAEFAKTWSSKTRATAGLYHTTRDVFAPAQRAGGQFAIEQPLGARFTLAADWYTGSHALGYLTPGIILKATSRFTWYGSYQIGNSGVSRGNHQLLVEFGWNFN